MRILIICFVTSAVLLSLAAAGMADQLRVGAAAVKITPPVGIGMAGYYVERGAQGTHDDLYAKAIVLQQGETRVALVALDLISTTHSMVKAARRAIQQATGIPPAHVMISATHSHTGPVLTHQGTRVEAQGAQAELATAYSAGLSTRIAECVRLAASRLQPARALAGIGRQENLPYNRRFFMKDGSVGWNPGKLNPNIVRPTGPVDPDVGVILFEPLQGNDRDKPLAAYINYAMHPDTVGGMLFSADYPGVLAQHLAVCKGEDMVTLFANGCCGNINHIDVNWSAPQKGYNEAYRIGTILAATVLQTCKDLQPVKAGELRVRRQIVKLPLPAVTAAEIEQARETVARLGMQDNRGFMEKVQAYKVLDVAARQGQPHEVEVQVIALGDEIAWVSLPGEIFVELGLAIKKASPFRYTLIAELANGSIGYIPSREAYSQGNYEPVSARCAEGSGELLVDVAVRMLLSFAR